jgi:membrane protease YdiL (CAAX protease family)
VSHTLDLLLLAALAGLLPVYEHFRWPATVRRIQASPHAGRLRAYRLTIVSQWGATALIVWAWLRLGRTLTQLGLVMPAGWRLALGAGLCAALGLIHARNLQSAARSAPVRAQLRTLIGKLTFLMPHDRQELRWFLAVSATAGICEELVFRGYVLGVLRPWIGIWLAATLGVVIFGLLHAYQGRAGILKTGAVGAVMTLVVLATRSLYAAMVLHVVIDAASGTLLWLALRDAREVELPAHDEKPPHRPVRPQAESP